MNRVEWPPSPFAHDHERSRMLIDALDAYRPARTAILTALALADSNRDPLAEWSEHLVAALIGGTLAASRVQRDYDLELPDAKVQVRYLANPSGRWINEHTVRRIPGVRYYALVVFEALHVVGVVLFDTDRLAEVCAALGKRHSRQAAQLQLTQRNWNHLRVEPVRFAELGAHLWLPTSEPTSPAPDGGVTGS